MSRVVWARVPVDLDCGEKPPTLTDGEHYIVRLADGSRCWAEYVARHGTHFERVAEDSEESTGEVLSDVCSVLVSGYTLALIEALLYGPTLTDRVVAETLARIPAAMARAKHLIESAEEAKQESA